MASKILAPRERSIAAIEVPHAAVEGIIGQRGTRSQVVNVHLESIPRRVVIGVNEVEQVLDAEVWLSQIAWNSERLRDTAGVVEFKSVR